MRYTLRVFISGGTGYIGQRLVRLLLERGHSVSALARSASAGRLPKGATAVPGDALQASTFSDRIAPADTFVHLVGVSHPAPWKEREFRAVDLASVKASVTAAQAGRVKHFVYVSVAQPAPVMKSYIQVRTECEAVIAGSGLNASILRPWYILGPGHRWPVILIPIYAFFEQFASTRDSATRLGLVTIDQMVAALAWAVENPSTGHRVISVPEIRKSAALRSDRGGDAADRAIAAR
jgi:nucleoside-diphosphate-sugar epimerase